jgi:accessory colonization factor AcfC
MAATMATSIAADSVRLHAAGGLRGALSEIVRSFETSSGLNVEAKFGPPACWRTRSPAARRPACSPLPT